jgi:hypothetical protein
MIRVEVLRNLTRLCLAVVFTLTMLTSGALAPAQAQGGSFDVFVNSAISKGKPGLYFVDARTGLSTVVVTNGTRHTLLEKGVLFQENDTGLIKIAYPDGRIELHSAMQPTGANQTINWVASANHSRIAWSVSQRTGTSLLSDLFVAESSGGDKKLVLHTSSTRNVDTLPLAVTDDGATVFYSRQDNTQKLYQLFPLPGDVFSLDVQSGKTTELPAKSPCVCAVGFSPDGRRFGRLEPSTDPKGFGVRLWDLSIQADTPIKAPGIAHTQAGYLSIARDGSLAIYTSARGLPPARGVPPERYALILVDVARHEQRLMTDPLVSNLRPVAFEPDNSAVLVVGVDKDGTYKLSVKDGTLLQVSAYTFLGTISGA